jgi:hypothetical protein
MTAGVGRAEAEPPGDARGGLFEAGWDRAGLMERHREVVSAYHRGRGRETISLDWTLAHHERGPAIFGVKKGFDYVENCMGLFQTVITGVAVNRDRVDGVAVEVQKPNFEDEERGYLEMTSRAEYERTEAVLARLVELVAYVSNRKAYRKRTEIAVDIVKILEDEGHFPTAHSFDNGVLTLELAREIEGRGKHWVSEIEMSRLINWRGEWRRVDEVAEQLRSEHRESFRRLEVRMRIGERKTFFVFTKSVRLKRYGRKRLVIVHESETLSDTPRFLLTDALRWESGRVIETWSYRWGVEIFHEFGKQAAGLESAQVRKEEAVVRHFQLSCVAQSVLQSTPVEVSTSERFEFAKGTPTLGQRLRTIARQAIRAILELSRRLFAERKEVEHVFQVLMPA